MVLGSVWSWGSRRAPQNKAPSASPLSERSCASEDRPAHHPEEARKVLGRRANGKPTSSRAATSPGKHPLQMSSVPARHTPGTPPGRRRGAPPSGSGLISVPSSSVLLTAPSWLAKRPQRPTKSSLPGLRPALGVPGSAHTAPLSASQPRRRGLYACTRAHTAVNPHTHPG